LQQTNFLGKNLTGYLTSNSVKDEITRNKSTWLPYILGVVNFTPNEVKFAPQWKLDIINYIAVERENIRREADSDFV